VIYSPGAGLVLVRNLEVGGTVVPGTPIFQLANTQQLWIAAMVDERVAGDLRVGQPARITFRSYPGRSFPGHLARLAREADRVTEEREVDVTVGTLPPEWFIGAKADVYIETARKTDALQISRSAVVTQLGKPGVFVIRGGHARWQPVHIGLVGRDVVEVLGGVDTRDLVIPNPVAGQKPITEGARVTALAGRAQP
jgi:HlyD family secretion protein